MELSKLNFKSKMINFSYFFMCILAGDAAAADDLGSLATNITSSLGKVGLLITGGSYVAGLAFAVGAIMKFKAHKDNPTNVQIGVPIGLTFIAAALLFLPSILNITGGTMFGENANTGGGAEGTLFSGGK